MRVDADLRADRLAPRTRPQREARDRRDARQRLAAEAEGRDGREVLGAADLAGRVPLDREPRVLRGHPLAIVLDAHEALAAELDRHRDTGGAGVEGVLHELLHDRGGTLDDLAGGNLVGQFRRQSLDAAHQINL
jgi:hypothetical protein